jgi:hypothetical protein
MAASPADSVGLDSGVEPPLLCGQLIHQQVYPSVVCPVRVILLLTTAQTSARVDRGKLHGVLLASVLDLHRAKETACQLVLADIAL